MNLICSKVCARYYAKPLSIRSSYKESFIFQYWKITIENETFILTIIMLLSGHELMSNKGGIIKIYSEQISCLHNSNLNNIIYNIS